MEDKVANYNGCKIYYRTKGSGAIVLLLHGFGETGEVWNELANALSIKFKVIIPDIPGSGNSELLNKEGVTIDDYAKVMKSVLDQEERNENITINIIGHSMGGYIALAFADLYLENVARLGLFHSSAFADDENKINTRKKAIEFIAKNGPAVFLRTSIPELFSEKSKQECSKVIEDLIVKGADFSAEALIQYYNAMIFRPAKIQLLEKIEVPVLFIIGEEDKAVPLDQSLKQCHISKITYVRIYKDVAHMGMYEKEVDIAKEVSLFLTL